MYKPIELELNKEVGFMVVNNSFQHSDDQEGIFDERTTTSLTPVDIFQGSGQKQEDQGQGLISTLLNNCQDQQNENRIKVMICITMYSEKLSELEKSLAGIGKNLTHLLDIGIAPHQIAVTVIFDGITNVHNVAGSYRDNIVPYFSSEIDKKYGFQQEQTLTYQYNQYQEQLKRFQDYKPENIKYLRAHPDELLKKYKKHRVALKKTMERLKGSQYNLVEQDEWIEQNIVDAMEDQYNRAKDYVQNRKNTAWVYQDGLVDKGLDGILPIFYTFKFSNGSKLSSHMWFFKGFCKIFNPDYCVLMDVGANPQKDAIFQLIMAMEQNPKLGGVCGTMRIQIEEDDKDDVFSIQKCQSCEYDIAHLLDKQAEAALDFIHVLPGAFSAYRYNAFFNNYQDDEARMNTILDKYLGQVLDQNYEHQTLQEANMFLAEDRVLCKLLFCNGYYLRYIASSLVYVDPCSSLKSLILQRRRWINGSWHALSYISDNYDDDLNSSQHSWWDRQKFKLSITQAKIQQLMIYFMESFQILWLYMILYAIVDTGDLGLNNFIISTVIAFYVYLVFMIIYLAINYDPALIRELGSSDKQKAETDYYFSRLFFVSTCLGFISLGTVVYTIYLLISEIFFNFGFNDIVEKPQVPQSYYLVLVVVSIGSIILPIMSSICLLPQNILNAALTMIPYFYYQPTYMHLFVIYSFCRIDDLSWGTKGLTNTGSSSVNSDKAYQKFKFLLKWIVLNTLFTACLLILFQIQLYLLPQGLILFISVILTLLTILKGCLALWYRIKYYGISRQINQYIQSKSTQRLDKDYFDEKIKAIKKTINEGNGLTAASTNLKQDISKYSYVRASAFVAFLENFYKG
ncbi:unnamed protein product (macronuclear) [Paramecium tetraurelia]|uniref:chitin synthase n=1 Tax=Paramecium tetraurelia TaxID=5888 RepID=A0EIN8_PARTE|nr:uncharacterized protein GSPATT00027508001 [Paramecium tetraurelia]CAK95179.1 unnamed protein product [Paramecium tetraurelia]|eukprot:XP_001462552.1 hypothetical protein (macronuclear) [Paramecium tetraurelia strain d4-2]